jgi:hypothetical protein
MVMFVSICYMYVICDMNRELHVDRMLGMLIMCVRRANEWKSWGSHVWYRNCTVHDVCDVIRRQDTRAIVSLIARFSRSSV